VTRSQGGTRGSRVTRPQGGTRGSRVVHLLQDWSARTAATGMAAVASMIVIVTAMLITRGDALLVWFGAVAASITLVMVFVIQHTQTRQQVALQHKLDELLRALPGTDERLIKLESAPPAVVEEITKFDGPVDDPAKKK